MFNNLIHHSIVLLVFMPQIIVAFQPVTENNHVLVGYVFQQLQARDWFSCIQACHDEPRCISYNYERSAGANGLCELNDCGVKDLCDRNNSLIYSLGFVFQQIRQKEVSTVSIPLRGVKGRLYLTQGLKLNQLRYDKCCSKEISYFLRIFLSIMRPEFTLLLVRLFCKSNLHLCLECRNLKKSSKIVRIFLLAYSLR